jgi:CrcB protein
MGQYAWVALGSAVGGMARYWCTSGPLTDACPWLKGWPGTFLVNVLGSMAIGLLAHLLLTAADRENLRSLLMTGVCGGYTTFSAFSLQTFAALRTSSFRDAVLNVVLSVVVCVAATWAGHALAAGLFSGACAYCADPRPAR